MIFLVDLNTRFDQVRVKKLSKELLNLNETISIIRVEESWRSVMLKLQNLEGFAMVVDKGNDQKVSTVDHKRVDRSRFLNCDNKDNLWCTYYQKTRHTRGRCWKLHGKP